MIKEKFRFDFYEKFHPDNQANKNNNSYRLKKVIENESICLRVLYATILEIIYPKAAKIIKNFDIN